LKNGYKINLSQEMINLTFKNTFENIPV